MRKKIERTTALLLCLLMAAVWLLPAALASATPTDLPEPAPEQPIEQAESLDPEMPAEEVSEDVANECSAPETDDLLPDETPAHEPAGEALADELTEEENLPADIETPAETSTEPELDDTQTEPDASAQAETETTDGTDNSEEPKPSEEAELTEDEIVETQFGGSWIRYAISKDGYAVIVNNRQMALYPDSRLTGSAIATVDYIGAVFLATAYKTGEDRDSVQVWYLCESGEVASGWARADMFRNYAMSEKEIEGCKMSLITGEMNHAGMTLPVFLVVVTAPDSELEPDSETDMDAAEVPSDEEISEEAAPEIDGNSAEETGMDGDSENTAKASDDTEVMKDESVQPASETEQADLPENGISEVALTEGVEEAETAETVHTADEVSEETVETDLILTATADAANEGDRASTLPDLASFLAEHAPDAEILYLTEGDDRSGMDVNSGSGYLSITATHLSDAVTLENAIQGVSDAVAIASYEGKYYYAVFYTTYVSFDGDVQRQIAVNPQTGEPIYRTEHVHETRDSYLFIPFTTNPEMTVWEESGSQPWQLIERETAEFDTGAPNQIIELLDEDGAVLTTARSDDSGHVVFDSDHTADGKSYYSKSVYSLGGYQYRVAVASAVSHHSLGGEGQWGAIQNCAQAVAAYLKEGGLDVGVHSYIRDLMSHLRSAGAHVKSAGTWSISQAHVGDVVLPADDGGHVMLIVAIDYESKKVQCATICHSSNWHEDVYGSDINWAWITVNDAKSLYKLVEEEKKNYTYRVSEEQDDPTEGQIRLLKKDALNEQPLAGVTFNICQGEMIVGSMTTDTNGIAVSGPLPAGEYTLREQNVPAGYVDEPAVLTCTVEALKTVELVALNEPIRGSVRIVKTDSVTGEPLAGAVFTVTCLSSSGAEDAPAPGEIVATITTNANGIAATGALPCGEYRIDETGIPDGYLDSGYTTTVQIK